MRFERMFILFLIVLLLVGAYMMDVPQRLLGNGPKVERYQVALPETENTETALLERPIQRDTIMTLDDALVEMDSLEKQGRPKDALQVLIEVSNKNVSDPLLDYHLGRINVLLGNYGIAATHFQRVLEVDADNQETFLQLLHMNLLQEQYEAFDVLLGRVKDTPEKLYYQFLKSVLTHDYDGARLLLQQLGAVSDQLSRTMGGTISRLQQSFSDFDLYQDGSSVHLQTLLAQGLLEVGEPVLAEDILKSVISEKKDYVDGWILMGYAHYLQERYDFARTAFETAYALDATNSDVVFYLGITAIQMERYQDGIAYLKQAEELGYAVPHELYRRIGDAYLALESYDDAMTYYKKNIELVSDKGISHYVRPMWMYIDLMNLPAEALRMAKEVQQQYPEDAMAYNLLGWAYLANGSYEEAENYLLLALSKDRGLAAAYLNLGKLYQETGNIERAKQFYQKAYFMDTGTSVGNTAADLFNSLNTNL